MPAPLDHPGRIVHIANTGTESKKGTAAACRIQASIAAPAASGDTALSVPKRGTTPRSANTAAAGTSARRPACSTAASSGQPAAVWRAAAALRAQPGATYLTARGLPGPWPVSVRWLPAESARSVGLHPSLPAGAAGAILYRFALPDDGGTLHALQVEAVNADALPHHQRFSATVMMTPGALASSSSATVPPVSES